VSRRHAAIFATHEGKWVVEDLDSANKTFLNGKEIHKAEIKTGDGLRVGSFLIEISLEGDADVTESIHLEDTILPHAPKTSPAATGSPRDA
jgi:pSer/pThr/pTyr-binding forkhead associated (FHA) protein